MQIWITFKTLHIRRGASRTVNSVTCYNSFQLAKKMESQSGRTVPLPLKEKNFLFVNSTIQHCPNKINQIFLIKDIFYIFANEKICNGPNGILRGFGEIDS
jgi:hypothetical protein